jgi:hypothetical protein
VALSTNLVFSEWERIFKDPMTTLAAIDRVVHHAVILDLMAVESYRAREAQAATAQPSQQPQPPGSRQRPPQNQRQPVAPAPSALSAAGGAAQ